MTGSSLARAALAVGAAACLLGGCRGAYYKTREAFGSHKRDILVERVEEAREDQHEAAQSFEAAYDRFRQVAGLEPDELEGVYKKLQQDLDRCEDAAADVSGRIESIEEVAGDLFGEWQQELEQIQSEDLRAKSGESLEAARDRYGQMIAAMQRAESKMEPVLVAFRDHVLVLKHSLNARAIASLQDTVDSIEGDIAELIADMQASIQEADEFIAAMESG